MSKYDRDNRIMDRLFVIALIFALLGLAGIVGCILMIIT